MDKLKLTYFDFPGGRAEPVRLALHLGEIAFDDYRFAFGDFPEVRKTTPLNQVPTLHINDLQVTQSDAITRYVGKLTGLYPDDYLQALLCDEVMSALEDVNVKLGTTFGLTGDDLKNARNALVAGPLTQYLTGCESTGKPWRRIFRGQSPNDRRPQSICRDALAQFREVGPHSN